MRHVVCAIEEPTLVKYDPLVVYLLYNTYKPGALHGFKFNYKCYTTAYITA